MLEAQTGLYQTKTLGQSGVFYSLCLTFFPAPFIFDSRRPISILLFLKGISMLTSYGIWLNYFPVAFFSFPQNKTMYISSKYFLFKKAGIAEHTPSKPIP